MWKSAFVGVYQLLNWKMHGETLKLINKYIPFQKCSFWENFKNMGSNQDESQRTEIIKSDQYKN